MENSSMAWSILATMAGLYLLLKGMQIMKEGLENLSRHKMRRALTALAATPTRAAFSGMILTALAQSSTAVSVLTIGFVNAGLLSLVQAVGILLGANVGTCITVQLISLPLQQAAIPVAILGAVLRKWGQNKPLGQLGLALLGFGAVFTALWLLAWALQPLQYAPWFNTTLLSLQQSTFRALLAGSLVSALLHSSAAATGLVMLLINQNLITLPTAIALVLGNNIGTCFTGLLASLSGSRAGIQVAVAHVLLNILGALLFWPFLEQFAHMVAIITPSMPHRIAHAHTLFNVISSLLVLPIIHRFVALVRLIVPDQTKF